MRLARNFAKLGRSVLRPYKSSGDGEFRTQIDVLDRIQQLYPFLKRSLKFFPAGDQSGAACTFVDHRGDDGFLEVIRAGGSAAVDETCAPHEAIRHLVAAKIDGMVAGEIEVNALVELAVTGIAHVESLIAAVVLRKLLLNDVGLDGHAQMICLAAARIDTQRRSMVFAGAGHPPAMLARRGQSPLLLESRSMILGALPDAVDVTTALEVQLQPDDRILLYTDGITEVFDSRGEMLGISGLQENVRQTSSLAAKQMKQGILDGVAAWREGPPTDDVSFMLVHLR